MKLLFITPPNIGFGKLKSIKEGQMTGRPAPLPPLGVGYLTAVVERLGHEAKVIDLNVMPWPPEEEIREFSPDLILISAMTFQYNSLINNFPLSILT